MTDGQPRSDAPDGIDQLLGILMDDLFGPIAPGVEGFTHDFGYMFELAGIRAATPRQPGAVGRYLDSLPTDREVIVPFVMSERLEGMLQRREFTCPSIYDHPIMGLIDYGGVWVRRAKPGVAS